MKIDVLKSNIEGFGVFACKNILESEIIEICPIIILQNEDICYIDKTKLYNYYFNWESNKIAISLGYGSLYNHSYNPNAIYLKDYENNKIIIKAIKNIKKNEEILVNYNGNPEIKDKVWFDKK